jgi:hypothetical protein
MRSATGRTRRHRLRGHRAQRRREVRHAAAHAQPTREAHALRLRRVAPRRRQADAALDDRAIEQPSRERRRDELSDAHPARRLAEDRDAPRIAAELRDVAPHPAQRRDLIEQPVVAGRALWRFRGERGVREEAERAEPVVERDDDGALLRQPAAVVPLLAPEAGEESAAVDPHHHRPQVVAAERRRPHVEVEAVLRYAGRKRIDVAEGTRLHAVLAEAIGGTHGAPPRGGLRRSPPQVPHRRRGVGDAAEGEDAARVDGAAQLAFSDGDDRAARGNGEAPRAAGEQKARGEEAEGACHAASLADGPGRRKRGAGA